MEQEFKITFWGVRGSYPVPGPKTVDFGGNTACVQVEIGEQSLILDAGTGISKLGEELAVEPKVEATIFLSHTHWDHIQGFPFFNPGFTAGNSFTIYGRSGIEDILAGQMREPYFPVNLEQMAADLKFEEITGSDRIKLEGGSEVTTFFNSHPGETLSFRIEQAGRSCCYVTDMESAIDREDVVNFISGTDLAIYDSHYTDNEYSGKNGTETKLGWGHSTWQEALRIGQDAGVEKLVLFHHAPWRSDQQLREIEKKAQKIYPNTVAAREGLVISL